MPTPKEWLTACERFGDAVVAQLLDAPQWPWIVWANLGAVALNEVLYLTTGSIVCFVGMMVSVTVTVTLLAERHHGWL